MKETNNKQNLKEMTKVIVESFMEQTGIEAWLYERLYRLALSSRRGFIGEITEYRWTMHLHKLLIREIHESQLCPDPQIQEELRWLEDVTKEQSFRVDDEFDELDMLDDIGQAFTTLRESRLLCVNGFIDESLLLVSHLTDLYKHDYKKTFVARRINLFQDMDGGEYYKTDEFYNHLENIKDETWPIKVIIYDNASLDFERLVEVIRRFQLDNHIAFWLVGDRALNSRIRQAGLKFDHVDLMPIEPGNTFHLEVFSKQGCFWGTMQFFIRPKRLFLLKNIAVISMQGLLAAVARHIEKDELFEAYTELKITMEYGLYSQRTALFMPAVIAFIRHYLDPIRYYNVYSYDVNKWLELMRDYIVRANVINPGDFAQTYNVARLPSLIKLWKMDRQLIKENLSWKRNYDPVIASEQIESNLAEFIDNLCYESRHELLNNELTDPIFDKVYQAKPYLLPYDSYLELITPGIYNYLMKPLNHYRSAKDYHSMKMNVVFAKVPGLVNAVQRGLIEDELLPKFMTLESFADYLTNRSYPKKEREELIKTLSADHWLSDQQKNLLKANGLNYNEIKVLEQVHSLPHESEIQKEIRVTLSLVWFLISLEGFRGHSESHWKKHQQGD